MALNNTTADALAAAICSALGVDDAISQEKYRDIYRLIYAALKADIVITVQTNAITTVGSAATQTGPQTPLPLSPA